MKTLIKLFSIILFASTLAVAQEKLPTDTDPFHYHAAPRFRNSEGHPLRLIAYALHPIGWVLREAIIRPFSYFASADNWRRDVLGYREPYDFRKSDCFGNEDAPQCRTIAPFNYAEADAESEDAASTTQE